MYLTRIEIDFQKRESLRLLASPSRIHGIVESGFLGERKRNLWRMDYLNEKMYVLILSEEKPDYSEIVKTYSPDDELSCQTKNYNPLLSQINLNSVWRFRLTANPTKSSYNKGSRGKVYPCKTVLEQENWLISKAEKNGFSLKTGDFSVVHDENLSFNKKSNGKIFSVNIRSVSYEGFLTVTDVELFKQVLCNGLGRGKAYGQGLLTLMKL